MPNVTCPTPWSVVPEKTCAPGLWRSATFVLPFWDRVANARDLVKGTRAEVVTGTPTIVPSKFGRALNTVAETSFISYPASDVRGYASGAGPFSVVAFYRATGDVMNTYSNRGICGIWGGTSSEWVLWTQVSATLDIAFAVRNATNTANGQAASTAYRDNLWHLAIGTWDGANVRLFVDGVLAGGPTAHTDRTAAGASRFSVGSYSEGGGATNGAWDLAYMATHNKALTSPEILQLATDPFCMIRPARRRTWKAPAVAPTGNPWYAYAQQ